MESACGNSWKRWFDPDLEHIGHILRWSWQNPKEWTGIKVNEDQKGRRALYLESGPCKLSRTYLPLLPTPLVHNLTLWRGYPPICLHLPSPHHAHKFSLFAKSKEIKTTATWKEPGIWRWGKRNIQIQNVSLICKLWMTDGGDQAEREICW